MMMGNSTGSQSAAIQGVQMGSFLLSLLLSGYLFAVAEHTGGDSLVVQLPARNPLHSDCSQFDSARRGMGNVVSAGWLRCCLWPLVLRSECDPDAQDAVQGIRRFHMRCNDHDVTSLWRPRKSSN